MESLKDWQTTILMDSGLASYYYAAQFVAVIAQQSQPSSCPPMQPRSRPFHTAQWQTKLSAECGSVDAALEPAVVKTFVSTVESAFCATKCANM